MIDVRKIRAAREKALEVIKSRNINKPPAFNVVDIVKELGFKIRCAVFHETHNHISGNFDSEENAIYLNTSKPAHDMISILTKVIGIFYLGKNASDEELYVFTVHFLMPQHILDKYIDICTVEELSKMFMVNERLMRRRLTFLD